MGLRARWWVYQWEGRAGLLGSELLLEYTDWQAADQFCNPVYVAVGMWFGNGGGRQVGNGCVRRVDEIAARMSGG